MADLQLVTGYTWADGGVRLRSWQGVPPVVVARNLEGSLSFRVHPGRFCTGFSDGEGLAHCPTNAPATRGTNCDACSARDAFRPCMTCDGFRCPRLAPAMLAWCRQTHHLYLACFGDDEIKVGTASHPRRVQRVIEQGPLAAAHVAKATGPRIKQIEHLLVEAGFTETMRRTRKTMLIQGAMTEVEARSRLIEAARMLVDVLPREYHGDLHAPIYVPQPALATRSRGLTVNQLEVSDNFDVRGEVVGAVGHLLFVQEADGRFALDLGALKGRRLEWDPSGPPRKAVAQMGLF